MSAGSALLKCLQLMAPYLLTMNPELKGKYFTATQVLIEKSTDVFPLVISTSHFSFFILTSIYLRIETIRN
jgi:hypothetical protein